MTHAEALTMRVTAAIGPLLMARDLLVDLIPASDDCHSARRATDLAQTLVDQSVAILTRPDRHESAANVVPLQRGDSG